jgi:hypothetical protein
MHRRMSERHSIGAPEKREERARICDRINKAISKSKLESQQRETCTAVWCAILVQIKSLIQKIQRGDLPLYLSIRRQNRLYPVVRQLSGRLSLDIYYWLTFSCCWADVSLSHWLVAVYTQCCALEANGPFILFLSHHRTFEILYTNALCSVYISVLGGLDRKRMRHTFPARPSHLPPSRRHTCGYVLFAYNLKHTRIISVEMINNTRKKTKRENW